LGDRTAHQLAADRVRSRLQTRHQRRAASQERRQRARKLRHLKLQQCIPDDRQPELQAVKGDSALFGPRPRVYRQREYEQRANGS
jgi:hypothetical protein